MEKNIITAPVSISNVKETLGESSNSLGNLCISDRVNMWAKYKPVRLAEFSTVGNSQWYRGDDLDCGIQVISNYGSVISMVADAKEDKIENWIYKKPRGGEKEPFRLGDFNKYYHNSQTPLVWGGQTETGITNAYATIYFDSQGSSDVELTFNDIYLNGNSFGDLYFGIAIYNDSNQFVGCQTQPFRQTNNFGVTNIFIAGSNITGSYRVIPFFSTTPVNTTGAILGTIYPLPFALGNVINVINQPVRYKIDAAAFWNTNKLNELCYTFSIQNRTGGDISTGEIYIDLLAEDKFTLLNREILPSVIIGSNQNYPLVSTLFRKELPYDIVENSKYFQVSIVNLGGLSSIKVGIGMGDPETT